MNTISYIHEVPSTMYSRFSKNSEAYISEFLENIEEMLPRMSNCYSESRTHDCMVGHKQMTVWWVTN